MHEEVIAGIDIFSSHLHAHVLPRGMHTTVNNDAQGIGLLIELLRAENPKAIVMEATGEYEITVAAELWLAGLPVAIVNSFQVRDFVQGIGRPAKTDAIDAYVLARFGQTVMPEPKPLQTEDEKHIEELVTRRRRLVDLRASERSSLHRFRSSRVRHSIETLIAALDEEIQGIDRDFDELVKIPHNGIRRKNSSEPPEVRGQRLPTCSSEDRPNRDITLVVKSVAQ